MITEDYVSFETAKLLKEKGFDCNTNCYYLEDSATRILFYSPIRENHNASIENNELDIHINVSSGKMSSPTLQMAMKWLREVHRLFITIEIKGDPRKQDFIYFKWSVAKYSSAQINRIDNGLDKPEDYWIAPYEEDETYERACEAAIKYCLEKLI